MPPWLSPLLGVVKPFLEKIGEMIQPLMIYLKGRSDQKMKDRATGAESTLKEEARIHEAREKIRDTAPGRGSDDWLRRGGKR